MTNGDTYEFLRHTMTILISYYTFHITLNFATLGFIVGKSGRPVRLKVLWVLAILFVLMNIQGAIGFRWVRSFMFGIANDSLGRSAADLYGGCISLMILTVSLNAVAWILVAYLMQVAETGEGLFEPLRIVYLWIRDHFVQTESEKMGAEERTTTPKAGE